VPNMFRTMAHRPEIFETIIAHMETVLNTRTLPEVVKELVLVRTSQLNRTPYCLASHTRLRKLGWTEMQIEALHDSGGSEEFSEREKVAIHLAGVMTLDAHAYSKAEFARLRSFYSEGEVVELMAAIGLFNYVNRFNESAGDGAYEAGVCRGVGYDGCWCYDGGLEARDKEERRCCRR
jgi:uncharacterized peroxidase-related enzyme